MGATRSFLISLKTSVSPHFCSGHDTVTMDFLVVLLIIVTIHCSEVHCDTLPTTIAKPEDTGFKRNNSHAFDKGAIWRSFALPQRKATKLEESRTPGNKTIEANSRKSRLLGSLAFLAGLSFGGLASAASSTVRNIAKLPQQASFSLNLGNSKASPYIAAYYNPYSLLSYPLFYPAPLGLMPTTEHAKPQTTSHNDLTPQVISVIENREHTDFAEDADEEYADEEKKSSNNGKSEANRNAEEKTMIHGCKGGQRRHGSLSKGSAKEREDLQVDVVDLRTTLHFRDANMTANANQTVTGNTTVPMTTSPSKNHTENTTPYHYYYYNFTTRPPFPGYYGGHGGYYGGHPHVNHVDLTTGSDRYYNYSPINYNLPYEQPANFYHNDKYNVYSSPNTHLSGPFSSIDQPNDYIGPDLDRLYHSEYQPPYTDGFRPVK